MTKDRDTKALIRTRMRATGQTYTAARQELTEGPRREQERLVARWFEAGRLTAIPAKRRTRAGVLLQLVTLFEPHRSYPEKEVNDLLRTAHPDVAYLRRELVNYGYLTRADGIYRLASAAPRRAPHQAQEIPTWEAVWLPGYLAGRTP
ncbi:MAG: DUF2087 domain-containing protein [Austwickia sp.]|jgi:hypothetical protein|nr:MAG: DUF2087 domain-containing protein [Austwickia sp.]